MPYDLYETPLNTRYASVEMSGLWSAQTKHSTWRRLWLALAEAEAELGLRIRSDQLDEMRSHLDDIDFALAAKYEREFRHDVMAHVHAFGDCCPNAKAVIHLGATSCYVTDNSELIQIRGSLELIRKRLVQVIDALGRIAVKYRDLPCLGFTHLQPAQPTTVGKRATLWCQDLALDLEEVEHRLEKLRFRGVKGTTGTQATFLTLFGGDHAKVVQLDKLVAQKMGFAETYAVTGQTYSRKVDAQVLSALSGIGQSAHKVGSDLRILQSLNEVEEPSESSQIGSSAMAYKRNPMRAERMCALSRFAMSLTQNGDQTMATQWMERTLDDSANRRLSLPQSFLAIDAVLIIYRNIAEGLKVFPKSIAKRLNEVLPFMATEEILMTGVQQGGDRQVLHERIRVHSLASAKVMKEEGVVSDLMQRLADDSAFAGIDLTSALDPARFIGRAPEQVDEFLANIVDPIRSRYADCLQDSVTELKV